MRPAGLVLAGGLGSRLGASVPKPLVDLGGTTALAVALARLRPFCDLMMISANDATAFADLEAEIVPDRRTARLGPLAGIEAAAVALEGTGATHLVSLPGDTPFLPVSLVPQLLDGAGRRPRIASFRGRHHPTVALFPLDALRTLSSDLDRPGASRSVMAFLDRIGFEAVAFAAEPAAPGGDPFFNVNTPDDLALARHHLATGGANAERA